MRCNHYFRS